RFALSFDTRRAAPSHEIPGQQQKQEAVNRAQREQSVVELENQVVKLKQSLEKLPQSRRDERAAIEARIAETERNLEEHRKALAELRLNSPQEAEQRLKQLLQEYQP